MNERSRLAEARHFLDRMYAERGNPSAFARELSAFMVAARSVLQYALQEAKLKPGGQQWYDRAMAAEPLLRFFKDKSGPLIHAGGSSVGLTERPISGRRSRSAASAG